MTKSNLRRSLLPVALLRNFINPFNAGLIRLIRFLCLIKY